MSAPRFVDCRCSHTHGQHAGDLAPQCHAPACNCLQYRPNTGTAAASPRIETTHGVSARPTPPALKAIVQAVDDAPPAPAEPVGSVDELLAKAKESDLKPIVRLAERIEALADDLRERVADEAASDAVKAHIAKLTKQLADAKAKLRKVGAGKTKPAATPGKHACPDCPETFGTPQGLGAHRAGKHGYRKADAKAAAAS